MLADRLASATTSGDTEAERWRHYALRWADWSRAEHHARTLLTPLLATPSQPEPSWWFIRKHPCWRVRIDVSCGLSHSEVSQGLDKLVHAGQLTSWRQGIYEAETTAFGGTEAMAVAHDLFRADSQAILTHAPAAGRREISLILSGALMQGAGLEWYERGDLWRRVSSERPLPADVTATNINALAAQMRPLMLAASTSAARAHPELASWSDSFAKAGRELRRLADDGTLERGLRAVLSYHVIFHWNRMGLPARAQAILARAARVAILDIEPEPAAPLAAVPLSAAELTQITASFPLIRAPRLHAADLQARITEARKFVDALSPDATPEKQIENACTTLNLAALICADCGLTERAAELCENEFDLFRSAWPLSGRVAIASLQPLVNLIRLTRRAGGALAAKEALALLESAVHHGGSITIGRRTIDFENFTARPDGLAKVRPWLRVVLLEDGTRALMAAHAWDAAAEHAAAYDGQPDHLREARQTRILALAHGGHIEQALALLATTELSQPWEHAVAACLTSLVSQLAGSSDSENAQGLIAAVHLARARPDRATTSFRTRLALTALHLTSPHRPDDAAQLAASVASDIASFDDSLCARDALAHPVSRRLLSPPDIAALESMTASAYLKAGTIPVPLCDQLDYLVDEANQALSQALNVHQRGTDQTTH